jgi:hypothetical protein
MNGDIRRDSLRAFRRQRDQVHACPWKFGGRSQQSARLPLARNGIIKLGTHLDQLHFAAGLADEEVYFMPFFGADVANLQSAPL